MKLATESTIKTLGNYAYQAIQKHFTKILKWEKPVKKDEDPEALHQMRVGMRRLRTAFPLLPAPLVGERSRTIASCLIIG